MAALRDIDRIDASLNSSVRRAIDIHEGEPIDEKALKALIRAAAALNTATSAARKARTRKKSESA